MTNFDEINIGDTLGPLELVVSKDQCRAYAKLMGMGEVAGRFTDDEAAKKEGLPGMILPGNMSLGPALEVGDGLDRLDATRGLSR